MKRLRTDYDPSSLVRINAGGKLYCTTERTLIANFPDSLVATLFKRKESLPTDEQGNFFIDADPVLFGAILNVLRRPSLVEIVPEGIKPETWWFELDYWRIKDYVEMEAEVEEEPLPLSLASKLSSFKERSPELVKATKRDEFLIIDKILMWCKFDHEFLSNSTNAGYMEAYLVQKHFFIVDGVFYRATDAQPGPSYDVVAYIEVCRDHMIQLMKKVMGFDHVYILLEPAPTAFEFEGTVFAKSSEKRVRIVIKHNFRTQITG